METTSNNFFVRKMFPIAVCALCFASSAVAGEPPAIRSAIEGRAADYQRQDPGVPVWPSTCDCISVGFGFKDANGYRPVRFSVADAPRYYGQDVTETAAARRSRLTSKGPLKTLVADDVVEVSGEYVTSQ
ncbi:hypothetical protein N9985_00890 [Gammaproteobacteria bacterium]|nr:hypothetical protein [Gammaproteobacteria bacterium]